MKTYGVLELTEASPAQSFTEPLTLAQVKAYCRIAEASPTDEEEDALLNSFITSAREIAEVHQGFDLVEKQWDLTLDAIMTEVIELRKPLKSVDLFQYRDIDGNYTTLTEGTDYIVDLVRGIVTTPPNVTWPNFDAWPTGAVLIRFTSGYSTTHPFWSDSGKRVLQGMRYLIEQWYDERLPFVLNAPPYELPFGVTVLLGYGAKNRVI